MSLSDAKVQRYLRRHFTTTWGNTDGDPAAGESFAHAPGDTPGTCIRGNGEHNVQLLILTPDGEILSALAGYLSPLELMEELQFAQQTWTELNRVSKKELLDHDERAAFVADAHSRRTAELTKREWEGFFGTFEKKRALGDHRFSARHALQPYTEFRIEDMVGNGRTFFGSSTNSTPGGRIGTPKGDGPTTRRPSSRPSKK